MDADNALIEILGSDIAFELKFSEPSKTGKNWQKALWAKCKIVWAEVGCGSEGARRRWWSVETRGRAFKRVRSLTLMVSGV